MGGWRGGGEGGKLGLHHDPSTVGWTHTRYALNPTDLRFRLCWERVPESGARLLLDTHPLAILLRPEGNPYLPICLFAPRLRDALTRPTRYPGSNARVCELELESEGVPGDIYPSHLVTVIVLPCGKACLAFLPHACFSDLHSLCLDSWCHYSLDPRPITLSRPASYHASHSHRQTSPLLLPKRQPCLHHNVKQ